MGRDNTYDVTFEGMSPEHFAALFSAVQDYHRDVHRRKDAGVANAREVDVSHDLLDYLLDADDELIAQAEDFADSMIEDLAGPRTGNPVVDMFRALGGDVEIVLPDDYDPEDLR